MTPATMIFYENQNEHIEQAIFNATGLMVNLLKDLRMQSTARSEIEKRFRSAKTLVKLLIDLDKRFKEIFNINA